MKYAYFLIALLYTIHVSSQVSEVKQHAIDSVYQIATNTQNTSEVRLRAYNYCCWKTAYLDFNQGLKNSTEYLALAKTTTQYQQISKAHHFLGLSQMMLGQFEDANKTLQEGLKVSIENNLYRGTAEIYGDLGNLHNNVGNPILAIDYHQKSLACAQENKVFVEYARAKINIGEIYKSQGKYKLSFETFQEALDYSTKHNFIGFKSSIFESLGDLNITIKEYQTAEKNYTKAVEYARRLSNNNRLIIALDKLGQLNQELLNYDIALKYYNEALNVATTSRAYVLEAKVRTNLASLNLQQKDINEALTNINIALNQFQKLKVKDDLDKAFIIAAKTHTELNHKKESKNYYKRAYEIAKETNHISALKNASEGLAIAYEESGNLPLAIKFQKEYNTYSNLIRNEEGIKEIIRFEMQDIYKQKTFTDSISKINEIKVLQYEYDQKEERIKLRTYVALFGAGLLLIILLFVAYFYNQKKKIAGVLSKKNETIKEALADKEILLKEVHHRVKNNMQVVSSLLHLKSKNTDNKTAKDALIDSKKRIDAMQLAHQKMYQKGNYKQIDIIEYFNDIVDLLLKPIKTPKDIFTVNGKELWVDVEQAQALGFILHELITNSIKYAWLKTESKEVNIDIFKSGNDIHFNYADNGKGLPDHIDITTTKSFGLKLINSLSTRQLLGKIEMHNANGFTINIIFNAR